MAAIVGVHARDPVRRNVEGSTAWFYHATVKPWTSCPEYGVSRCQLLWACRRSLILLRDGETMNLPAVLSECP